MSKTLRAALLLLAPLTILAQDSLIEPAWIVEQMVVIHQGTLKRNQFTDIYLDAADNVYCVGRGQPTWNNGWSYGAMMIKYNEWGDRSWSAGVLGSYTYSQRHIAHALATDSDTAFYMVGALDEDPFTGEERDALWVKYDSSGSRAWFDTLPGYLDQILYDVTVADNGNVYACGIAQDTAGGFVRDYFLVMRIDPDDGDTVWTHKYEMDPSLTDRPDGLKTRLERRSRDRLPAFFEDWDDWYNCACAIEATADNGAVVTGYGLDSTLGYQMWTMKFQPNGNRSWVVSDGAPFGVDDDAAFDIAVSDSGYIYISGFDDAGLGEGYDFAVYRYNSTGSSVVRQSLNSLLGDDDIAYAMCLDDASPQNVYATGVTDFDRVMSSKYNAGLTPQWGTYGALYGGVLDEAHGYDIHASDGYVYVAGDSSDALLVLGYTDASESPKAPVWHYRYINPDTISYKTDVASSVWASDTDHVVVTGASERDPLSWSGCHSAPVIRLFHADRDIRADTILDPMDTIPYGVPVSPRYWVVNEGNDRGMVTSYFHAGDGFADTVIPLGWIYPNDTVELTHSPWTPGVWGNIVVRCSVAMVTDNDHTNDGIGRTVFAVRHDVGCSQVVAPGAVVDSGVALTPQVRVYNWGNVPETFDCWLRIGAEYRETAYSVTVNASSNQLVSFPDWSPVNRDTWAVSCSTMLAGDMAPDNDSAMSKVFVRVQDVMAKHIYTPSGPYDPYDTIWPEAEWQNNGNLPASFEAWMLLDDPVTDARVYAEKIDVTGLAPGLDTTLSQFPGVELTTFGYWTCRCSTAMDNDLVPGNDYFDLGFLVGGDPDIGIVRIVAPTGVVDTAIPVTPRIMVYNYGNVSVPFGVRLHIYDPSLTQVYFDSAAVPGLMPGMNQTVELPDWAGSSDTGGYLAVCSLAISDLNPDNDTLTGTFLVSGLRSWPMGWTEVDPVPLPPSGRPVKRGGWLTALGDNIYIGKGYKTQDFYRYEPLSGAFVPLTLIPMGDRGGRLREAKKGSRGEGDGEGHIYYVAGNNTLSFFRYTAATDSWARLPDVPEGPSRKQVKGGDDMQYVVVNDTGYVYLLKGYKNEFYRFNTATGEWEDLPSAPYGRKDKWNRGSWIVYDGDRSIYAHQANYYNRALYEHYMFKYDIPGDSWFSEGLHGMPLYGLHSGRIRKKKSKDGGCAAWFNDRIYALKGGNTQQFFRYNPESDSWTEIDTMPNYSLVTGRKRRVKYGADITTWMGALWALKGNKTREFWRYGFGTGDELFGVRPERSGVAGGRLIPTGWRFEVTPNPFVAGGVLSYAVPRPTALDVAVIDAVGRRVRTVASGRVVSGRGSLRLDTDGLARGVYLLRVSAPELAPRALKLVLE